MSSKIKLTIMNGALAGTKFGIEEHMNCFIGRDKACTIAIANDVDPSMSRNHCLLEINPPDIIIQDLNSRNGTYVNGKKINYSSGGERLFLNNGDTIQVGETVISVEIIGAPPETGGRCQKCGGKLNNQGKCEACAGVLTVVEEPTGTIIMNKSSRTTFAIEGHKIIRLLGRGGMGAVFFAEEEDTGRKVALKVILPRSINSPEAIDEFLREADTTASLMHKNIIEVRNINYTGDLFYFSMEYCESGSLFQYIESRSAIDIKEAVDFTLQILDGLHYAHNAPIRNVRLAGGMVKDAKGIVHRDIKPENIYLQNVNGRLIAKIADFGLSKAFEFAGLSGFTKTGAASGSPMFMCRNHLRNYKYAKAEVDLWATAATLYYMLTKEYPRNMRDDNNFIKMILETDPVPVKKRNLGIPTPLAQLIDKALIDSGELYFQSAEQFKEALIQVSKECDLGCN